MDTFNSTSKDFYIKIINQSTFSSYFTVSYSYNNSNFNLISKVLEINNSETMNIYENATNIILTVYLVKQSNQSYILYKKTFSTATNLKLLLKGTEAAPLYSDITNQLVSEYYISLTNTASFTGKIFIKYTIKTKTFSYSSKSVLMNDLAKLCIPKSATNIQITVKISDQNTPWNTIYTKTLAKASILKLSLSGKTSNPICNDVTNDIIVGDLSPSINLTKHSNQTNYNIFDTVTFTLVVSNTGGSEATDIVLSETIISEAQLIYGSLTVDGFTVDDTDFLKNGLLEIPDMSIGDSHIITYEIVINCMPSINPVKNNPVINYNYNDANGLSKSKSITGISNSFTVLENLEVIVPPLMQLIKIPDKTEYIVGDTISFTIIISNTNGGDAKNVILTDNISSGQNFLDSSLTLDNVSVDGSTFLSDGLKVSDMSVGDSHIITYQILITSMPYQNPVEDNPSINYDYANTANSIQNGSLTGKANPFTVKENDCPCCPYRENSENNS